MNVITPEQAGISSRTVLKFLKSLERKGIVSHSVLMMRGNGIFAEAYWKPFAREIPHRMYSQTKSFVGVAVGLLAEEGKLRLDGRIADYFPEKIDRELPPYLKEQTVRQMLTMQTCGDSPNWFYHPDPDRTHLYFAENRATVPAGMRWRYDSPGSQVLSSLVEKLSGQSLFDYLNDRIFRFLGTFRSARILKTKTDDSFGDSAMLCTARDIASFARFVMNGGTWNGKRLMNEAYLRQATAFQADNRVSGFREAMANGYGYQIWKIAEDGFAFYGMGGQLTLCFPKKDFIFVCTGDNQGYGAAISLIVHSVLDFLYDELGDAPLPEDEADYRALTAFADSLELEHLSGPSSPYAKELSEKTYLCEENPAGIKEFSFLFRSETEGELRYVNEQGEKTLRFGINRNAFGKFPQTGYSDLHAGAPAQDPDFLYDCAVSAAWCEEKKLLLKVQIIDRYLGNLFARFSFRDSLATVTLSKTAEAFLDEYTGEFVARRAD